MTEARVFVSYRRDDSRHVAGRLVDHLRWEREVKSVFFDTSSIPPGAPFPAEIERAVREATHTLVVIGPRWNGGVLPGQAQPRLFDPADFVHREVATALAGSGLVIPVLVDGAAMPGRADLPPPLQPLAERNAYVIHNDRSFAEDLRPLLAEVIGHEPRGGDTAASIALKAAAGAGAGLIAFLAFSAVTQFGLGWTADDAFGLDDVESAHQVWRLLPYAFGLAGAVAAPLLRRRWRWPRWQVFSSPR